MAIICAHLSRPPRICPAVASRHLVLYLDRTVKPRLTRTPAARQAAKPRPRAEAPDALLERHPLDALFAPRSVALVGATDRRGSAGRLLYRNLTGGGFGGTVSCVNPSRTKLFGSACYPSIASIPHPVDLAVIATPAEAVPGIVASCAEAGVKSALVVSSGFRETGPEGRRLEDEIAEILHTGGLRLLGPNSLGIMSPRHKLNASLARGRALPGNVAF